MAQVRSRLKSLVRAQSTEPTLGHGSEGRGFQSREMELELGDRDRELDISHLFTSRCIHWVAGDGLVRATVPSLGVHLFLWVLGEGVAVFGLVCRMSPRAWRFFRVVLGM